MPHTTPQPLAARHVRAAARAALAAAAVLLGAPAAHAVPEAKTIERCEADAHEALQRIHGRALAAVRFDAAPRLGPITGAADEAVLRGSGRYVLTGQPATPGTPFQYSCALGAKSGETAGVVVRDAAAAARTASAERSWEPDLTKVSPRECESTTAALLKDRHPRATLISFDGETRRLEPAPDERIGLEGQGALQRAPGMAAAPFRYRCEFDARNGRIVSAKTLP